MMDRFFGEDQKMERGSEALNPSCHQLLSELFYRGGSRDWSNDDLATMWNADRNELIRIAFYLRQHRSIHHTKEVENGVSKITPTAYHLDTFETMATNITIPVSGRGERKIFHRIIRWLAFFHLPELLVVLPYIPDYGYWKDLLELLDTPAELAVIRLYSTQLCLDYQSFHRAVPGLISMAAKWTPNEGSSYDRRYNAFGKIAQQMQISRKNLRKLYLVPLRRYLAVTEQIITDHRWSSLSYSSMPQKALRLHRGVFQRYDTTRFTEWSHQSWNPWFYPMALPPMVRSRLQASSEAGLRSPPEAGLGNSLKSERISNPIAAETIWMLDISGAMSGFPFLIAAGVCAESRKSNTWIPLKWESPFRPTTAELFQPIPIQSSSAAVDHLIRYQESDLAGVDFEIGISLAYSTISNLQNLESNFPPSNKSHLIIISNILLDPSEIPPRPANVHITYWSIHLRPAMITDYPNLTIIEGYDLYVYNELKRGMVLTRERFRDTILNRNYAQTQFPTV